MGIQQGKRAWERKTEKRVINSQESGLTKNDLVVRYRTQASNYILNNPNLVNVIIGSGIRDTIASAKNKTSAATFAVRNNPHLIPDTIEDLNHQAAFLIAVAEELSKPEYKH